MNHGTANTSPSYEPARPVPDAGGTFEGPAAVDLTAADDAAELEALLGRLPLARPSAALDRRIAVTLERHRPPPAWVRRLRPVGLATAAALAVAAGAGPALLRHADPRVGADTRPRDVVAPAIGGGHPGDAVTTTALPAGPGSTAEPAMYPVVADQGTGAVDDSDATDGGQSAPAGDTAVDGGEPVVHPVNVERTFERVRDDGVVLVEDGVAYTRVRREAVRRIVVVDPATGRQVVVTVPTSEVRVRKLAPF